MNLQNSEQSKNRVLLSAIVNTTDFTLPTFSEQMNKSWVPYGINNMFPNELLELFNKSGSHNAIIESKVRMMGGDGIYQDTEEENSERTQYFIDNPNPYESMDDIFRKCSMDFELFGLSYIECIWSKDKSSIAEIYHTPADKIRWGRLNEKNKIETFYYSKDWSNYRKSYYQPIEIPIFNDKIKTGRQLLPIIRYTPGLDYYAFPDYIAGLKWITIDTEIANFHFNNLQNGMSPSIFFGFPVGTTTEEERRMVEEKIQEKYVGTSNAGKFILAFYDAEGNSKPEVTVLEQTNADKQYELLNTTTLQQILVAHKVTNENLVGISTPGKLGSANEVLANYELYYNTVVKPEQTRLLDAFNKIMLINGMNPIKIAENKPLNIAFSENIMKEILTGDEMREVIGYEPLENDQLNEITEESDTGLTLNGVKFQYDLAGVSRIDKSNAIEKIKEANLDDIYMWRSRTQTGKKICPSCENFNGQTRTLLNWLKIAIPGQKNGYDFGDGRISSFPYSPFGTFCEDSCNCQLVKIGSISKK